MSRKRPQALFLDRDGALIKWVDYLRDPSKVVLEPGIAAALAKAKRHGCRLFMHTNQSGVGRGYFAMDRVNAVNDEMYRLMGLGANPFDAVCIAPDDPSAPLTPSYRKPNPRFELEMIEKFGLDKSACYMVGDRMSDIETGWNAGISSVGIGGSEADDRFGGKEVEVFESVAAFVDSVCSSERGDGSRGVRLSD